ncbi:hypothetical protein BD311DRAFT_758195 [Dichomitus squalens]|uniref:Uncharacterized protein n=1 Tax=Dichomitus squalens TaxID=114155 RepID=A0A4Q9MLY9_9APHY|nr:hypothetical protein BD311DRAFT_758195 [Dichomitus squalens]
MTDLSCRSESVSGPWKPLMAPGSSKRCGLRGRTVRRRRIKATIPFFPRTLPNQTHPSTVTSKERSCTTKKKPSSRTLTTTTATRTLLRPKRSKKRSSTTVAAARRSSTRKRPRLSSRTTTVARLKSLLRPKSLRTRGRQAMQRCPTIRRRVYLMSAFSGHTI